MGLALTAMMIAVPALAIGVAPAGTRAPGPAFPQFASPAAIQGACDRGLADTRRELKQLERRRADGGWLGAYDAFMGRVEDRSSPMHMLNAAHPDKAMRDAAEACVQRWESLGTQMDQNPRLDAAVRRLKPRDAIDAELIRSLREGFEDGGVALPPARRAEARRIMDRINEKAQVFERHIRDDATKVAVAEADLAGVPRGVWESLPVDAEGRRLLGLAYPIYVPVMQQAERESTRERMWRARQGMGGQANLKLLLEIAQLRKDYAKLFDQPSWDHFVIRRRMAGSPERVEAFLNEVRGAVEAREREELEGLRAAKAAHTGQPLETIQVQRWDQSFYTERVRRERHQVDEEAFRPYFPPQQSLELVMTLVERLMGVRYERIADAPTWHPEVQTWLVRDVASGKPLSTLYVDLYPRDGKYNHAAVFGLRRGSTLTGRQPQAALIVNFDRKGLTLDEMETLLHEFGHAVHNNLSATRYASQGGTTVKRDFVEAPSQMLEEWIVQPEVMALMKEVCRDCKVVPDEMLARADLARQYPKGLDTSRQVLYAGYDLALFGPEVREPLALWAAMEGRTPLGHVPGTMFPAGFGHVVGGYGAGYYGYLWSKVVAADLRTPFRHHWLDPKLGRAYRDKVLAQGGQKAPLELVRDFLGRETNSQAFFKELKR